MASEIESGSLRVNIQTPQWRSSTDTKLELMKL